MTDACSWLVSDDRDSFGKAMIGPVACEDQSDVSATCECEKVLQCVCIMPNSVCLV